MRSPKSRALCLAATLAALTPGCGGVGLGTVPVEGTVTYQGKPLTNGTVTFQPKEGPPAIGAIGPDGHYKLTTKEHDDGAIPGHYQVGVTSVEGTPNLMPGGPGYKPIKQILPRHLGQPSNSRVEADVSSDKKVINLDLK